MYTGLAFAITHAVFRYSCHSLQQHEAHAGTNKIPLSSSLFSSNTSILFIFPSLPLSIPLSLHIWPFLFLFPLLLFLFGRFNAFTPPLHSCGCFIHQSRHYSTNPTASSFAPLHLPLHHPPPHPPNTWSVPGGLYTPSSSAPLLPFTESLEVSLLLIF